MILGENMLKLLTSIKCASNFDESLILKMGIIYKGIHVETSTGEPDIFNSCNHCVFIRFKCDVPITNSSGTCKLYQGLVWKLCKI